MLPCALKIETSEVFTDLVVLRVESSQCPLINAKENDQLPNFYLEILNDHYHPKRIISNNVIHSDAQIEIKFEIPETEMSVVKNQRFTLKACKTDICGPKTLFQDKPKLSNLLLIACEIHIIFLPCRPVLRGLVK